MKNPQLLRLRVEFIESMKELITHYQGALKSGMCKSDYAGAHGKPCLLCNPINTEECLDSHNARRITEGCKSLGCPWIVILGKNCDMFRHGGCAIYQTEDPNRIRNRIKQLRRWIKIYENFKEI